MPDRYTIAVEIEAKDRTGNALGTVKRGFNEAFKEVATGAMRMAGESAMQFAQQIPAMVVDLGKLGVSVEASERRFTQFAGGADRATMFLDAFNEGSLNTVDRMTAMSSAGRLLQMGLVDTGDEMSSMAAMATQLGDQTMGAGERIADWASLLANQSIPRLDNFGISSGRVRQRIDELLASGKALNREQAFKMAVMEEGAKALETLGDTSDTAAVRIGKMTAAWNTLKQEMGVIVMEDAAAAVNALSTEAQSADEVIRGLPERFRDWRKQIQETTFAHRASNEEIREAREQHLQATNARRTAAQTERELTIALADNTLGHEQYSRAIQESMDAMDQAAMSAAEYHQEQALLAVTAGNQSTQAFDQYQAALDATTKAQDDAAAASLRLEQQLRDESVAAMETAEALLDAAMQYVDYEEQITDDAQAFADKREGLEQKHQEKLAELAKKGAMWRERVDEDALSLEVRIARGRLDELLKKQAEFNIDTSDLDRARTEQSIRNLEEQIAKKTMLLEQAQDGYVMRTGQNVDQLIAEENRQYEASLLSLEEAQAAKEESQRESLGRMVLNHFNAWVEMNLAADGYTQEEAAFVQRMRNQISLEYGLITDEAVVEMSRQEAEWASMIGGMQSTAVTFFDLFMQRFNELPSEKVIRIRTEMATPQLADPSRLGGETMQHGSAFAGGGWAMVGERGPEMAYIPRGASVFPTDQSQHMTTQNYNLTVNSQTPSAGVANEFYLMEAMAK